MSRALAAGPAHASGPWLRELLWRLLLLVCAAAAVAVFALTLMLPGTHSPHRVDAQLPQVMLVLRPAPAMRTPNAQAPGK